MILKHGSISLDLLSHVHIMGILNVTPDSFSDGGRFTKEQSIITHVSQMIDDGVDIIDIGGESSRPFAPSVSTEEELKRIIPAIHAIRRKFQITISIDTTKAKVAKEAILAGANIINDISACRFDPEIVSIAKETGVPIIIMHMQGTPSTMQVEPHYDNVIEETISFFKERINFLRSNGIAKQKIIIDPGIGFGKNIAHNLQILNNLQAYKTLGCPLLIGHSRKAFIGKITGRKVDDREIGTAVISSLCAQQKVSIIRVHDVGASRDAVKLTEAIQNSEV